MAVDFTTESSHSALSFASVDFFAASNGEERPDAP